MEHVQRNGKNVEQITDADIGISFTGVAGPDKSEGNT